MSTLTIPVNFKSDNDATGHYKKITISVADTNMANIQLKAENLCDQLKIIDGREWSWSLPYTVV